MVIAILLFAVVLILVSLGWFPSFGLIPN